MLLYLLRRSQRASPPFLGKNVTRIQGSVGAVLRAACHGLLIQLLPVKDTLTCTPQLTLLQHQLKGRISSSKLDPGLVEAPQFL